MTIMTGTLRGSHSASSGSAGLGWFFGQTKSQKLVSLRLLLDEVLLSNSHCAASAQAVRVNAMSQCFLKN